MELSRTPRRRRRAAQSCSMCRQRKIKCDRNNPCAPCVAARHRCVFKVYNDPVQSRMSVNSRMSATPQPEAMISASPSLQDGNLPTPQTGQDTGNMHAFSPSIHRRTTTIGIPEPNIQDLLRRVRRLEAMSSTTPSGKGQEQEQEDHRPNPRLSDPKGTQFVMHKAQVMRFPMGIAPELNPIITCFSAITGSGSSFASGTDGSKQPTFDGPEISPFVKEASETFQNCKNIIRSIKYQDFRVPFDLTNLQMPTRNDADLFKAQYFMAFESAYRILHKPTFDLEYQQFWADPKVAATGQLLKNLLVLALGSSLNEHDDSVRTRKLAHQWIQRAQEWLSDPLEKDRISISGLQIHCLTVLARKVFSIGEDNVWLSTGELIHKAMQMGLQRDPDRLPAMSVFDIEMRRRLWATILELAVQSALDCGMPPRISLEEFDTKPPSNIFDDEIQESSKEVRCHGEHIFTSSTIQRILLTSLPTRLEILRLVHGVRSQLTYDQVLALSSKITSACVAINDLVNQHPERELNQVSRNLLDYLVRRFYLTLHIPFATIAQIDPRFYYSMKVCVDTAITITNPPADRLYNRFMVIGRGFFKESFTVAATAVGLELLVQTQAQQRDGTIATNPQYVTHLKRSLNGMVALVADCIRETETGLKDHMFLSMILAHADSIVDNASLEWKIAQGILDSVTWCCGVLEQRAEAANLPGSEDKALDMTSCEDDGLEFDFDFFRWTNGDLS